MHIHTTHTHIHTTHVHIHTTPMYTCTFILYNALHTSQCTDKHIHIHTTHIHYTYTHARNHIYTHTHTHAHSHYTHIYTYTHVYNYIYTHIYIYYICTQPHTHTHIYMHTCTQPHTHIHIHISLPSSFLDKPGVLGRYSKKWCIKLHCQNSQETLWFAEWLRSHPCIFKGLGHLCAVSFNMPLLGCYLSSLSLIAVPFLSCPWLSLTYGLSCIHSSPSEGLWFFLCISGNVGTSI